MRKKLKIFVAGHNGMVGGAICRELLRNTNVDLLLRTKAELDLTNQLMVHNFLNEERPDQVYLAAAKVGGILANQSYPAEFIYNNLIIASNVIHGCFLFDVKKLLFLASSCIYPKITTQPMKEDSLLTGKLEPTNEPYAIAKIAGIKLCESYNRQYGLSHSLDYRSILPTNLYGYGDNYHPNNSHVIPGLIRRFHEAMIFRLPEVKVWGTGNPKREFLDVKDLARACVYIMNLDKSRFEKVVGHGSNHINVGYGQDISIRELSFLIAKIVGFKGSIVFDANMPDGTELKLMDNSKTKKIGWSPSISLEKGLSNAYENFLQITK